MLDAERRSAILEDFVVLSASDFKELTARIANLEFEVICIKRAAANGAWCRRSHNDFTGTPAEFLPPLPTTIC